MRTNKEAMQVSGISTQAAADAMSRLSDAMKNGPIVEIRRFVSAHQRASLLLALRQQAKRKGKPGWKRLRG